MSGHTIISTHQPWYAIIHTAVGLHKQTHIIESYSGPKLSELMVPSVGYGLGAPIMGPSCGTGYVDPQLARSYVCNYYA